MKFNLFLIFALLSINSYADLNGNLEIIPNTPIKATDVIPIRFKKVGFDLYF